MSKFTSFLVALVLLVTLTPVTLASHTHSSDKALKISSADIEADDHRVTGDVTVCNKAAENLRFILSAKNETVNLLYLRRLSIKAGECATYKMKFNNNFAEMSNTGDEIKIVAKSVKGYSSFGKYDLSDPYIAVVKEGHDDPAECGDEKGGDGIYTVCENDFIYHEATGLRIKVIEIESYRTTVLVTHVRWGGVKKLNVYLNRSKDVVSGDEDHTKVEMTNLVGETRGEFLFQLKSL